MQQISLRQFVKDMQTGLNQMAVSASAQLGKGQCANFEEYKSKVGFIKGLEAAAQMADQMVRAYEDAAREGKDDLPEMTP